MSWDSLPGCLLAPVPVTLQRLNARAEVPQLGLQAPQGTLGGIPGGRRLRGGHVAPVALEEGLQRGEDRRRQEVGGRGLRGQGVPWLVEGSVQVRQHGLT